MTTFVERLYPYFPVWAQNLGVSAYGWRYKRERFGTEFYKTLSAFEERDRWSFDRMVEHVGRQVREVVRQAFQCKYYRDAWSTTAFTIRDVDHLTAIDLALLPILEKEQVRKAPQDFVPDSIHGNKKLLSYFSSGSTGTPIRAIYSRKAHQRFVAAREARSFGWAGTSIRRPRAMIGGRMVVPKGVSKPPFYRYNWAENQVYFSAYHIAPDHISNYVEGFNKYRPELITGYAFSQFSIARMMLEQGLRFDYTPVAAVTSSEKLTRPMRETIYRSWGCRAYEEYGAVENCMLATECEYGRLHVSPDFGIIEIVDDHGFAVPPGVEGRILCTGLLNDAQLLIRYDIGDFGIWSDAPCPCGRAALPVLEELTGRIEDVVIGPDGREMVRFHGIFVDIPFVLEGQVVQEAPERFTVRVITEQGFGEAQVLLIKRRFQERLGPVTVSVDRVDFLERTERGKLRAVISHVAPKSLSQLHVAS